MSESISGKLSRISETAPELNRLGEQATEQIRALDAYFEKMNLGISCFLDPGLNCYPGSGGFMPGGREKNRNGHLVDATYDLGYGRDDDGKFGIILAANGSATDMKGRLLTMDGAGEQLVDEILWVRKLERVSRDLRIAAVKHLPALVEMIAKKAESTIESLRGGVEETQAVVDELEAALSASASAKPKVTVLLADMLSAVSRTSDGLKATGYLNRRTGEVAFVGDSSEFEKWQGKPAFQEMIARKTTIETLPSDWVQIPKPNGIVNTSDRKLGFIKNFLSNKNLFDNLEFKLV